MSKYQKTIECELYRASEGSPLNLPDEKSYGDQYLLFKMADKLRSKHSLSRLGSLFTGLTEEEARRWGDEVYKLKVEIPRKHANAYDATKWTELIEYYVLHVAKTSRI